MLASVLVPCGQIPSQKEQPSLALTLQIVSRLFSNKADLSIISVNKSLKYI